MTDLEKKHVSNQYHKRNKVRVETIHIAKPSIQGGWGEEKRLQINDSSKRKGNERNANNLHTEISFSIYQIGEEPKCALHNLLANILGTSVPMYVGEKEYWLNSEAGSRIPKLLPRNSSHLERSQ